uniref:Uncharacterized protein n=1 Tax=Acrobeloides nanus TaxID=290746 RepID=A0A914EH15_9BILA
MAWTNYEIVSTVISIFNLFAGFLLTWLYERCFKKRSTSHPTTETGYVIFDGKEYFLPHLIWEIEELKKREISAEAIPPEAILPEVIPPEAIASQKEPLPLKHEHTLLHIHIYCCHNSRSERSDSSDGSGTMGGSCASLTTDVSQRTDFSHRTDVSQRTDFLRRTDISGRTDVTQKSYSEGIQAHKPTKKNDKTSEEICNKS